jgi:hypothetical protein
MDKQTKQSVTQIASSVNNLEKRMKNLSSSTNKGSSRTRKRARRRQRQKNDIPGPGAPSMNYSPSNGSMVMSKAADTGLRRIRSLPRKGLTDDGIAFLKCAFAPPDFQASSIGGIPDDFRSLSLVRRHRFVQSVALSAAVDYYILLLPVPGVAFYTATVAAGTPILNVTPFNPIYYSDFQSMFGLLPSTTADTVTKYRFVSNHFELIPTVNQMTWSGTIQCWKLPITLEIRTGVTTSTADLYSIEGLSGCNSVLANQYSGPFIMGAYTACYNANGTFPFSTILETLGNVPSTIGAADFGQLTSQLGFGFPGLDNNFESMLIKISSITANESCLIKTWACVEYQANPNNALYEFSSLSPVDPLAIELYRSVISELPVGVPFEDNESFWLRVLSIVNRLSGVGSLLPGAYGMASRGVNLLSSAGLTFLR